MNNPYYTEPSNILPGIQMLNTGVQRRAGFERERVEKGEIQNIRNQAAQLFKTGTPEEIQDFRIKNPEAGKVIEDTYNFKSKQTRENKLDSLRRILIDKEPPGTVLLERAEMVDREGGDYTESLDDAKTAMVNEEAAYEKAEKEYSMLASKDEWKQYQAQQGEGSTSEIKVGSQEWLEDGTLLQSTPQGPRVYSPDQRLLKGKEAADAIARGRAEKVSNLRKAAGEKRTASLEAEEKLKGLVAADVINKTDAAKISTLAYKRLEGIYTNIDNLNEGIALLREDGANTGVIDKYLPSLKKSTLKLKNLQGRLGLDILRNTTFGSLSAQELKFALDTAFPEGLQPEDAAKWLEDRKNAQEKLADYIESAAMYLGTPGNTIKGYLEMKRNEQGEKKTNQVDKPKTNIKFLGFE